MSNNRALENADRRSVDEVVADQFLGMRADLLTLAASLDRISVASGSASSHTQQQQNRIADAIAIVGDEQGDKAKRLQHLFSRRYDEDWRSRMALDTRPSKSIDQKRANEPEVQ